MGEREAKVEEKRVHRPFTLVPSSLCCSSMLRGCCCCRPFLVEKDPLGLTALSLFSRLSFFSFYCCFFVLFFLLTSTRDADGKKRCRVIAGKRERCVRSKVDAQEKGASAASSVEIEGHGE